jgi:hypothetical protein
VVLLFTPISHVLLRAVNGSFAPTRYSSLALKTPSEVALGIPAGTTIHVELTNETGHVKTYHWTATQNRALISLGEETVGSGRVTTILVPSRGAVAGRLRISLSGTNVFLTVPIQQS